jgi:RNA polymerase sigma factor (sigma-70 family)
MTTAAVCLESLMTRLGFNQNDYSFAKVSRSSMTSGRTSDYPRRKSAASLPARRQDRDALFAEFSPLIRRLIRQYGQTPELRQELPGELFCRFQALLDSYDPERGVPLRPYLVRQLTAGAYAFARKQWNQVRRETPLMEGMECGMHQPALDPTSEWDETLVRRDMADSLANLIAELPSRQRQVVLWRYYEERSFEEIAVRLGVQESSVRSLLRHGMNNLRRRAGEN